MSKDFEIQLMAGQDRKKARNRRTSVAVVQGLKAQLPVSLQSVFLRYYGEFRLHCRSFEQLGVAVVAVDVRRARVAGVVCMAAAVGSATSVIVGRHGCCDLYLEGDAGMALRQLAVLVEPVRRWQAGAVEVSYRVLDLRTERGFTDETRRALRGMRCEGPAMIRCGDYALYFLPTGDPTDWPPSATDAWEMLPERVYFDELTRFPEGSRLTPIAAAQKKKNKKKKGSRSSHVTRVRGVFTPACELVVEGESAVGRLTIATDRGRRVLPVGDSALDNGVLLGRYSRCGGAELFADCDTVSRVHALLVRLGGETVLVDAGSTCGIYDGDDSLRRVAAAAGRVFRLGEDDAYVTWEPVA